MYVRWHMSAITPQSTIWRHAPSGAGEKWGRLGCGASCRAGHRQTCHQSGDLDELGESPAVSRLHFPSMLVIPAWVDEERAGRAQCGGGCCQLHARLAPALARHCPVTRTPPSTDPRKQKPRTQLPTLRRCPPFLPSVLCGRRRPDLIVLHARTPPK